MKIISVRAPWWWWIVYGGKDIENRDWPTSYRGPVLIHASKWWVENDFHDDWDSARAMERASGKPMVGSGLWSPAKIRAAGGNIVGRADIIDCLDQSKSPWFVGRYGFVLANAAPVNPIPFKGRLGLFDAPADVVRQVAQGAATPPEAITFCTRLICASEQSAPSRLLGLHHEFIVLHGPCALQS